MSSKAWPLWLILLKIKGLLIDLPALQALGSTNKLLLKLVH